MGNATLDATGPISAEHAMLFSPHSPRTPIDARFDVEADSILVNWTSKDGIGLGPSVSDPDDFLLNVAAPPRSGETRYDHARLRADAWDRDANWLIVPEASTGAAVTLSVPQFVAGPAAGNSWRAGYEATVETDATLDGSLGHDARPPQGWPLLEAPASPDLRVVGDAWLYLWGINTTVADARGRNDSYASGPWTSNETGTPADAAGLARGKHEQFLTIRLVNATLRATQNHGRLLAAAPAFEVANAVRLRADGATGRLVLSSTETPLVGDPLDLTGNLRVRLNRAAGDGRIGLLAEGDVTAAAVDGRALPLPGASLARRASVPFSALPFFALATVGGLFTWAGIAWRRRRWSSALDRAEAALLSHRPHSARRRLRTVLSKKPDDADAWFLYGATWLQEGEPSRVIDEIEPVARRLSGPDGHSLAFLLALAHARMRRPEEALEWLSAAMAEPLFRHRAGREPDFGFLKTDPRFQRLVETDLPAYG